MTPNEDLKDTQTPPAPAAIPEGALILLPVRNTVLFPGIVLPLTLGRPRSLAAAQAATRDGQPMGVIQQRDSGVDVPGPDELYKVGTIASVLRYVTSPEGAHHLICQGQQRFVIQEFLDGYPFLVARVATIEAKEAAGKEIEARILTLKRQAAEALALLPQTSEELNAAIEATPSGGALADFIANFMDISSTEKQQVLETLNVRERLDLVSRVLAHRIAVLKLSNEINEQTKETMDQRQREFLLREQLKTIQKELGETDTKALEIEEVANAITEARMPPDVEEQARRELKRLERMPEGAAEHSMIRSYLDWLTALP